MQDHGKIGLQNLFSVFKQIFDELDYMVLKEHTLSHHKCLLNAYSNFTFRLTRLPVEREC